MSVYFRTGSMCCSLYLDSPSWSFVMFPYFMFLLFCAQFNVLCTHWPIDVSRTQSYIWFKYSFHLRCYICAQQKAIAHSISFQESRLYWLESLGSKFILVVIIKCRSLMICVHILTFKSYHVGWQTCYISALHVQVFLNLAMAVHFLCQSRYCTCWAYAHLDPLLISLNFVNNNYHESVVLTFSATF